MKRRMGRKPNARRLVGQLIPIAGQVVVFAGTLARAWS
jgi:hypothetical protein